jgi:hypothetical protein
VHKLFDLVLGTVVCLFGVGIGALFLKTLDVNPLVIDRKLAILVLVPCALVGIGLKRIFKKRGPPARS